MSASALPDFRTHWRWWVCFLLLLATMINYMDRLTLNLLARHINDQLGLDELGYAWIEFWFAIAFAGGAILFGFIVDRFNVYWVYPAAVVAWSIAGFCTGFATGFWSLLVCRFCLGLAEAANWPCALRTTQRILPPSERSMGNSILQSGAALGAVFIPLVLLVTFDESTPQNWRLPFFVVGAVGVLWVGLWMAIVRPADLSHDTVPETVKKALPSLPREVFLRRFAVLIVLVISINMTWHFLRAWGPLYLQKIHGFSQNTTNWFSTAYYLFTDIGALSAGFLTLQLAKAGVNVHVSRSRVFFGCALMAAFCGIVPFLTDPWLLMGVLLVIGFGSLGMFPNYYSFTQDLTQRHQGKVTGTLGCCCWMAMAVWQLSIGVLVQKTGSYLWPFVISGIVPLLGYLALLLLWGPTDEVKNSNAVIVEESTENSEHEGIQVAQATIKQG